MANPRRGECAVDLGALGKFTARADHNAVAEIEASVGKVGRLFVELPNLDVGQRECAHILYATVKAFEGKDGPSLEEVTEEVAVMGLARAIELTAPILKFMVDGFERHAEDIEGKAEPAERPATPTGAKKATHSNPSSGSLSSIGDSSRASSGH